jgi:hypothetical protein
MKLSDFNLEGVHLGEELSGEEKAKWDERLRNMFEVMEKDYDEFVEKMRIARAKSHALAKTRVIG